MFCKFCGKEMNEGAEFCSECGKSLKSEPIKEIAEESIEKVELDKKSKKKNKNKKGKGLLVLGTIIIIVGVIRLLSSSVSVDSAAFGADFYTYTYEGIVACAETLGEINATLSLILIAFGSYLDVKALKERKE